MARSKRRLSRKLALTFVWWIWGLALVAYAAALAQNETLFPDPAAVWSWFVPNIFPTMTLVGAAAYGGRKAAAPFGEGATALFLLAVASSILYLGLLTQALLNAQISVPAVKSLSTASLWLGPLQGLVTSLLGFFFVSGGGAGREGARGPG